MNTTNNAKVPERLPALELFAAKQQRVQRGNFGCGYAGDNEYEQLKCSKCCNFNKGE